MNFSIHFQPVLIDNVKMHFTPLCIEEVAKLIKDTQPDRFNQEQYHIFLTFDIVCSY